MKDSAFIAGIVLLGLFSAIPFSPPANGQGLGDATSFCAPGNTRACPTVGICTDRVKVCEGGRWSEQCTGGVQPASVEICDNELDDNCNGLTDECVNLSGSVGVFLIIGGVIMLIFGFALSKVMG